MYSELWEKKSELWVYILQFWEKCQNYKTILELRDKPFFFFIPWWERADILLDFESLIIYLYMQGS